LSFLILLYDAENCEYQQYDRNHNKASFNFLNIFFHFLFLSPLQKSYFSPHHPRFASLADLYFFAHKKSVELIISYRVLENLHYNN